MAYHEDYGYIPDCPGSYGDANCTNVNYKKPLFGYLPVALTLLSCSFSVLGSIITILPYILWKDVRKSGIRSTITFLAIADLFTASGYIMASLNYLVYQSVKNSKSNACVVFENVCQIQAYIASFSSYSSFWWTSILALFFYWTVVKGEIKKGDRYFPVFHILSWGSPILVMLPLLATGSLGYSLFSAGGWCFIKGQTHVSNTGEFTGYSLDYITVLKTLAGGKAFEIGTYIWVIVMYVMIQYNIRKKQKETNNYITLSIKAKESFRQIEQKTLAIPIVFILIRIWGTLHFLFSIIVYGSGLIDTSGCTRKGIYGIYMILIILQALGDGSQGLFNAILYIALAPKIRQRLFVSFLSLCKRKKSINNNNNNNNNDNNNDGRESECTSVFYHKDELFDVESPVISSVTLSIDAAHINKIENNN